MDHKIDLRGRGGITLILIFTSVFCPFLTVIYSDRGDMIYYRNYDREQLNINLPVHSDFITVSIIGNVKLDKTMIMPLVKPKLTYSFNESKRIHRGYSHHDIKVVAVDRLPGITPACHLTNCAITLFDKYRVANMPQQIRYFVVNCHEAGHTYYDDEQETDRFGVYKFVNDGYNFSSAMNSLTDFLSPNNFNAQRMISMYNEIAMLNHLPEYDLI